MATKIPRSMRRTLKRNLSEDTDGTTSKKQATQSVLKNAKRELREQRDSGDIKRTKISWNVSTGDLVKIKERGTRQHHVTIAGSAKSTAETKATLGIVLYKHSAVSYSGVEEDYIIVMTPQDAARKLSPKSIEQIQPLSAE